MTPAVARVPPRRSCAAPLTPLQPYPHPSTHRRLLSWQTTTTLDDDSYGAFDSLYENDMLETVPVAPGEQSNYAETIAARRQSNYEEALRKQSEHLLLRRPHRIVYAVASWRVR